MFHGIVMRAFLCASVADLGARLTYHVDQFAIAPHVGHGESAHVRAIHIKLYAACQVRKIFFLQARNRAFIARDGTGIAGIDARPHLFVHGCDSWERFADIAFNGPLRVTMRTWQSSSIRVCQAWSVSVRRPARW